MRNASPPIPRRRRPHPAQRARKIAGAVSIAGMLVLTGCMVATTKTSTAAKSDDRDRDYRQPRPRPPPRPTTTLVVGESRSVTAAAVAATPAAQSEHVDQCELNPNPQPRSGSPEPPSASMGTDVQVIVVGGPAGLEQRAQDRVADLERRWSRFVDDSEVSALNRYAGRARQGFARNCRARATRASKRGGSRADGSTPPCSAMSCARVTTGRSRRSARQRVPGASDLVLGTGRDRDPRQHGATAARNRFRPRRDRQGPRRRHRRRRAASRPGRRGVLRQPRRRPARVRHEPEGERVDRRGRSPAVAPSRSPRLGITDGAAATSTTLRRRWSVDGETRHHLIDPTHRAAVDERPHVRDRRRRIRVGGRGTGQGRAAAGHAAPLRGPRRHGRPGARDRRRRAGVRDVGNVGLISPSPDCRRDSTRQHPMLEAATS